MRGDSGNGSRLWRIVISAAVLTAANARAQVRVAMTPRAQSDPAIEKLAAEPYSSGEMAATAAAAGGGRTKVRQLLSFENGPDGKPMTYQFDGKPVREMPRRDEETADAVYVQDKGVTDGKWCCRFTAAAGTPWRSVIIDDPEVIRDWSGYDYFAMDLNTGDDDNPYSIGFELWDQASSNYTTRCSMNETTRPGQQTLLYPINRARRNGKEGRDWSELEPKDKIDLKNLKFIKMYTSPRKDRPAMLWIDNLRLMQEDAAKPKMSIPLPKAVTAAYDFSTAGAVVPGFQAVTAQSRFNEDAGYGFVSVEGLRQVGQGWPDLLTGTAVAGSHNRAVEFKAKVPDGSYRAWLAAGPIVTDEADASYLLQLGDKTLYQDKPSRDQQDGEKYLYRFLWTQYSERPHALWLDFVSRMYPVYEETVQVSGGVLTLKACNFFLSALILVPVDKGEDFARMSARIEKARLAAFEGAMYIPPQKKPAAAPGDGDYLCYAPDTRAIIRPWTGPSDSERKRTKLASVAAPGQNLFLRLAVVPFKDLGTCELKLADLTGPDGAKIPASSIAGHFLNYGQAGRDVDEMILLPTLAFAGEKGITQCLWLWVSVPGDAKPGKYSSVFTFAPSASKPADVPVEIEILPIRLQEILPLSLGMYYGGRGGLRPEGEAYRQIIRDQLKWMRKIGFTGAGLMADSTVTGVSGQDQVNMSFGSGFSRLIKEAGLGRHPMQMQMTSQLGIGRSIARRLMGGHAVDQNPGCEFSRPEFKGYHLNALRQWKKYLDALDVPYAIEIVDEPREVPNPWNRTLVDTCLYGDLMKEAGFTTRFVTPMGDTGSTPGGKVLDYTALVDHTDIISIHAGAGSKGMQERTLQSGKALWYYNSGMSRYMWGFQPWSVGVTGRWEWHWCWSEGGGANGYPGEDWYNPFTGRGGLASNAPADKYPGGFLYRSGFLTAADGITDFAYLYSLTTAVDKNKAAGAKGEAVAQAEALLKEVRAAIPRIAHSEGEDKAVEQLDAWREKIGRCLAALQ